MFRKSVALIMIVVCTLVCFPVSSLAAESDLQSDFDNGLMTLDTSLTYYKDGVGHIALKTFSVSENNASSYADFYYYFDKYSNSSMRFGHRFDLSYNDNRVMIPQGHSFSFTIHNFYSMIYLGVFDDNGEYNYSSVYWVDLTKYLSFSMYFYDLSGTPYLINKDMYEVSLSQDDAMITVKMNSDLYDIDVHKLRLIITFNRECLWGAVDGGVPTEFYFTDYGQFYSLFGFESLYFEIKSEDEATTGLLTSIIEYVKSIWDSIKNLPANIKTALTSLFDGLSSSISGFFDSLKNKLTDLFSVFTEEQTTYAPIDEGELPSDYQAAEDEAFDAAGVGDLDSNIDSAFKDANSVFSNNNAYAFISGSMGDILFYNVKISGLIVFSLAMGLCVLILGRKVNA